MWYMVFDLDLKGADSDDVMFTCQDIPAIVALFLGGY